MTEAHDFESAQVLVQDVFHKLPRPAMASLSSAVDGRLERTRQFAQPIRTLRQSVGELPTKPRRLFKELAKLNAKIGSKVTGLTHLRNLER